MPQSHPTTGLVRFLAPVRFLACKAEWSDRRNLTPELFSWSHQATDPFVFYMAVHLWCDWIICRTPHGPLVMPVLAPYRPGTGSPMFFISYGAHTVPVQDLQGCRTTPLHTFKAIDTTRIYKNPARALLVAVHGLYGPITAPTQAVHMLFTHCLWSLNPYRACKLIMHALKSYCSVEGY